MELILLTFDYLNYYLLMFSIVLLQISKEENKKSK